MTRRTPLALPSQSDLLKIFRYCPETGSLFWLAGSKPNAYAGKRAGTISRFGYVRVRLGNVAYSAHRIIWAMCNGDASSTDEVDHINGIREDNRLSNLRLVSRSHNCRNQKMFTTNTSGFCGVSWNTYHKKWQAAVTINKKKHSLGYFHDPDKAAIAAAAFRAENGFSERHGT